MTFYFLGATMPLSVVTASECSITENVIGQKCKYIKDDRISIYHQTYRIIDKNKLDD